MSQMRGQAFPAPPCKVWAASHLLGGGASVRDTGCHSASPVSLLQKYPCHPYHGHDPFLFLLPSGIPFCHGTVLCTEWLCPENGTGYRRLLPASLSDAPDLPSILQVYLSFAAPGRTLGAFCAAVPQAGHSAAFRKVPAFYAVRLFPVFRLPCIPEPAQYGLLPSGLRRLFFLKQPAHMASAWYFLRGPDTMGLSTGKEFFRYDK